MSPYGVDVLTKLKSVVENLDRRLLDRCLKDICKEAAVVLKRQRGNAYGFGADVDSSEMITKNLSEEMLDDPEATNTKKIENYLGNLDRIITTTGPQGFDKATDDLVLKYGKDIILSSNQEWTSKENRKAAVELNVMQNEFKKQQEILKSNGIIEDADIAVITTTNKVQRVVGQCKKSHDGPWLDIPDMHTSVQKYTTNDGVEKKLHSILDYEIRYRKFTMTNVKDSCPLFRQRGLSIETKVKHLELLMQSQTIGFNANATMDDLENAILHNEITNQEDDAFEPTDNQGINSENLTTLRNDSAVSPPTQNDRNENGEVGDKSIEKCDLSSFWPPKKDKFVVALLEDGFFIVSFEGVGTNKL